jgi:hypothetical protein
MDPLLRQERSVALQEDLLYQVLNQSFEDWTPPKEVGSLAGLVIERYLLPLDRQKIQ